MDGLKVKGSLTQTKNFPIWRAEEIILIQGHCQLMCEMIALVEEI